MSLAEELSREYMATPWGSNPYRHVLGKIKRVLADPMQICPECEMDGPLTLISWPARSNSRYQEKGLLHARYYLCVYCGYRRVIRSPVDKSGFRILLDQAPLIVKLYRDRNWSEARIAAQFYASPHTIGRILADNGVQIRSYTKRNPLDKYSTKELELVHHYYERLHLPQKDILRILGWTPSQLRTRIEHMEAAGWFTRERRRLNRKPKPKTEETLAA